MQLANHFHYLGLACHRTYKNKQKKKTKKRKDGTRKQIIHPFKPIFVSNLETRFCVTYLYMKLFDCNLSHFEIFPLLPPLNINKGTFLATKKSNKLLES